MKKSVKQTGKVVSLAEAVERFVPDGASVAMGLQLESMIPFAAGHEIIRQRKRDLTLVGPISDILFDQMVGAGCARKQFLQFPVRRSGRARRRGTEARRNSIVRNLRYP